MARRSRQGIGYWEAVSIGVGGMVGGGIFAVLGLAVEMARGGTAVAFAIAGGVALLTTYSYARLSVAFPSQGGTVAFLDRAFGPGLATGTLNVLLWLSYVVMLALYAYAFGSYGATFLPRSVAGLGKHVLASGVILAVTGLNLLAADVIGRAEDWIVGLKLAILALFVGVGVWGIQPARLAPATWAPPLALVAGGMIIFLAYEGFELIANTAADVRDGARTLPRAFFSAVIFVLGLYVLIALVAVGTLPVGEIVAARDYALARAAAPFLGRAGFSLIAVAALLSTASAINATLYGAARISYVIAKDGELPAALEKKVWHQPLEGLLITAGATLVVTNVFDLSSISTLGSAGFLLIFAAVNWANVKVAVETKSLRWLSAAGCLACLAALAALVWRTATGAPGKLWVLAGLLGLAFAIEVAYRTATGRVIRTPWSRERGRAGARAPEPDS